MIGASRPLVSVVMPSRNQSAFIGEAIESVLGQDYPRVELIIADGASSDDTQDVLGRFARRHANLRWFSEPDTGPAQALNRALALVRGTVIGWLNSDDLYAPGAIARAVSAFARQPDWLMVYGHGEHVDVQKKPIERYPTQLPSTPIEAFAQGCFICQPSVFFKRTQLVLLGRLDESLKTAFDFDYWLRAFAAFPQRIGFIDVVQAYSRLHDDCITLRQRRQVMLEGMRVLSRHLGHAPNEWAMTYVDELLRAPDQQGLCEEIECFLSQAEAFLSVGDGKRLRELLSVGSITS